ncbi:MAG: glycosyltransferase family 39 protein [Anaerolineae bacterium]|nr:glycosyltransferase family 39 protein [Anaerolineae bacterium]
MLERPRILLPVTILIYLVLGTLYAIYTPNWQAPDEPAHYNYIRTLAEEHRFPILKPGDYPGAYLEEIKAARFAPELSIEPIRYEFHQPPLYYILAVPVYGLFGGALLPLRLLSLLFGALLLPVVYQTVRLLVPARPLLALGATAFVAFQPMHIAMCAAVNNDSLADLLLAVGVLFCVRYVRLEGGTVIDRPGDTWFRPQHAPSRSRWALSEPQRDLAFLLSVTTGLAFVSKSSVYILLPLALAAIAARHLWLDKSNEVRRPVLAAGLYLLPSMLMALPWWLRNAAIYGGLDILGLHRHNQVVAGQLRTADWVAQRGFTQSINDFGLISFRSFWAQFGWMGVLIDERLYQALAILSALALIGLTLWAIRAWHHRLSVPAWQWAAAGMVGLLALLAVASYAWYNLNFWQPQGRYLFRALLPIGFAFALGWREAIRRERAVLVSGVLLAGAALLRLAGVLPNWPLLMVVALIVALLAHRVLPAAWDSLVHAVPYLLLMMLAVASLFFFIVPQLQP